MEEDQPVHNDDIIAATNKLLLANKINIRNCFDINIEHISSLKPYERLDQGENWQRVSTHLISEAKIYSIKVESLHDDTSKLVNEYNRFSAETNVRKEPTKQQLETIKHEIESRLSYNPGLSNLDPSLKNDVMIVDTQPQNLTLLLGNKGLLLNELEISGKVELVLSNNVEKEDGDISEFKLEINESELGSAVIRQMTIFKEVADFNNELLELAVELAVDFNTKLDSDMAQISNGELMMDFDVGLFNPGKPDSMNDTRMDMSSLTMDVTSESTVCDWSRIALQTSDRKSEQRCTMNTTGRLNKLSNLMNESRSVGKIDSLGNTSGTKNHKVKRNRTKNKEIPAPIDFDPNIKVSKKLLQECRLEILKPIRLHGLQSLPYNQYDKLEPKMFIPEHSFGQPIPEPIIQGGLQEDQQIDPNYETPFTFIREVSVQATTGHGQHLGVKINRMKEILFEVIQQNNFVTDLKSIVGSMPQKPLASDMPFLFSALLHIAVEHGLSLAYGRQNIFLQKLT